MRLTEKYDDNSGYGVKEENYAYEQHLYIDFGAYENCVRKLGQLEDIEEELKLDLHEFLKCLEPNTLFRIMPYEKAKIIDEFRRKFVKEKLE